MGGYLQPRTVLFRNWPSSPIVLFFLSVSFQRLIFAPSLFSVFSACLVPSFVPVSSPTPSFYFFVLSWHHCLWANFGPTGPTSSPPVSRVRPSLLWSLTSVLLLFFPVGQITVLLISLISPTSRLICPSITWLSRHHSLFKSLVSQK